MLAALSAATVLSVVTALSTVATLNVPTAEETNRAAARAPSVARKQRRRPHAPPAAFRDDRDAANQAARSGGRRAAFERPDGDDRRGRIRHAR